MHLDTLLMDSINPNPKLELQIKINQKTMQSNKAFRNTKISKVQQTENELKIILNMFEQEFHYEIFISRCQDTGEKPDLEKAKMFKQSFNKINSKKYPNILNLYSMRLGVNTIMKLISILENQHFKTVNLADNAISEYGMHAIKNLINSCKIQNLSIASNMISQVGLSLAMEELIKNQSLKILDLGVLEGSIRKNSLGLDGARVLAAVLLQNKTLQCLRLEDNDIGINGAQVISISLKRNKNLKQLKLAENMLKTQGAQYILQNAIHVQTLDLGKNFIKSSIGSSLEKYFQQNKNIKKLNLELNQLMADGTKVLFMGMINSGLEELNVKGNGIGDRGLSMIADVMIDYGRIEEHLRVLDLSNNEITEDGVENLAIILEHLQLNSLNLSKNTLGDTGIIDFIYKIKQVLVGSSLQKLDISSCKVSDRGFLQILKVLNQFPELKYLKASDNYISEKYQKIYVEYLTKNQTLIQLNLAGNRLSLSGLKAIKKIIDRNMKEYEERQPKKMQSQIFNMKEKQKRIKEYQDKLESQRNEIQKLQETKIRLTENLGRIQREEKERRNEYQENIRKKLQQIDNLTSENENKIDNLQKLKVQKQQNLDGLNDELDKLRERRKQLQNQLNIIKNEGELIEEEFHRKNKMM